MVRRRGFPNILLAALLLIYAALATWYSLTIPLGEAPDEVDHYRVVRYLVAHRHLPSSEEEHEAAQPPLYYLMGAALTFWISDHVPFTPLANADFDPCDPLAPDNLLLHPAYEAWPFRGWVLAWHLARLVSVGFGALAVWAIYRLGRELFPDRPEIGLGMAALTAFTPQFLFMTAVFNNDNAATALSALVLWQLAALLRHNTLSARRLALLGLLLGLGLLSKSNLLALVPIVALAILLVWWVHRPHRTKALLSAGLLTFGLAGLLSGWTYVRNLVVFGDPLGLSFVLATNPLRQGPLTFDVLAWLFRGLSRSFWLGWIGIELDSWIYPIIHALCLVGLLGLIVWLVLQRRQIAAHVRWTLALLGLHLVLTLAWLIRWTAIVEGTDQGRLIFPLLPLVMLVLVAGLVIWLPQKLRAWGTGSLVAAWLALAVITPGRHLAPVHGPPETVVSLPSAAIPLGVCFGDAIQLLGYQMESSQVAPGEKLVLDLYWRSDAPLETNVWALVKLVDASGTFLICKDGSPSAGCDTTDRWIPGTVVASQHRLAIPNHSQPGTYWLTLSMHPCGEQAWLPIRGVKDVPLGESLTLNVPIEITTP
jgi:4-amino-4-deoxy-L-arabinose transferase-like glycosyltransferase